MTQVALDSTPDWSKISTEIICPLCDYNLRGLEKPRCPECGCRFSWWEVLDPSRKVHPYLYEHHPEHGFRTFWKTAAATMLPTMFWRKLLPGYHTRPWRLILYAFAVLALILMPLVSIGLRQIHGIFLPR